MHSLTRRGALRSTSGLAAGLALPAASSLLAACQIPGREPVGTTARPLQMAFAASTNPQETLAVGQALGDLLAHETGYVVRARALSAYEPMIAALGATHGDEQVDVGWLTPFAYALAHAKFGTEVILATIRNGSKTYHSQVIVHADSGIRSIAELKGKRFAFVDSASTSGFLYPAAAFKEKLNVTPDQFFSQVFTAGGHDKVVIAVYNKQVDGGACRGNSGSGPNNDARIDVLDLIPDVMSKVLRILEIAEPIPNDPVAVRKGLPGEVTARVKAALIKISGTDEGKRLLKALYNFSIDGLREAFDTDYAPLRQKADLMHINLEKALGPAPTPAKAP